uniref:Uncharacterized protein n=1 Tax=Avena sativa TaxID=4498 RepID=A0ACD6AEB9_AVESA
MGRPPSTGGPAFRFTHAEVAEMEERLRHLNNAIPHRDVIQGLADKFTNSPVRSGKIPVQPKQVWNWFQNRRYSQRSRTTRGSPLPQGKMLPTGAEEHHPSSFRAQPSSSGHSGSHPGVLCPLCLVYMDCARGCCSRVLKGFPLFPAKLATLN